MKIVVDEKRMLVLVTKDENDKRMSKESTFYYHLGKELSKIRFKEEGHFFRKEMAKDGHLIGPHIFYVTNSARTLRVYDWNYDMRNVAQSFNAGETIDLYFDDLR